MFGLHIRIRGNKIRPRAMLMNRLDYERLVSLIEEADMIDRDLLGDHSRTREALKLLKRAREINPLIPPKVSSGPDA